MTEIAPNPRDNERHVTLNATTMVDLSFIFCFVFIFLIFFFFFLIDYCNHTW
jgi:hypothetical protein